MVLRRKRGQQVAAGARCVCLGCLQRVRLPRARRYGRVAIRSCHFGPISGCELKAVPIICPEKWNWPASTLGHRRRVRAGGQAASVYRTVPWHVRRRT